MKKVQYPISNPDGTSNAITVFSLDDKVDSKKVILLFPAMGVAASYYEPFAEKLVNAGFEVITADIRGHGLSSERASRKTDFGYREIVELDYPAVTAKVKSLYPDQQYYIMGHSLGGQMASLYASRGDDDCAGLILIACCSVYYKGWSGLMGPGTYLFTQVFGFLPKIIGYFPGKRIGFAGTEPRTQMQDWAYQARTGRYHPNGSDFDYEMALSELKIPVLAISLDGDSYAPPKAVKHLLGKFHSDAPIDYQHLSKEDMGVPKVTHFSWVKIPGKLINYIADWF
ncbi:MAG: alpha/beta fold hydrolase [Bacteroidota bacterium]